MKSGQIVSDPVIGDVAAVSCGIFAGQAVLDLDYQEDSQAGVDGNFVMLGDGRMVEVQMSAEGALFDIGKMQTMLSLAQSGVSTLIDAQRTALGR